MCKVPRRGNNVKYHFQMTQARSSVYRKFCRTYGAKSALYELKILPALISLCRVNEDVALPKMRYLAPE